MIEKMPNLRHLQVALVVLQTGSINAAAEGLHLSQSAASQGMSALERYTGRKLLNRTRGGAVPTAAGRLFTNRIRRVFRHLAPLEQMLTRIGDEAATLDRRVTATQLRAIIALTEFGGYSRAAKALQLSQPSVFRAARDLERACGGRFFRRSPSGVECSAKARKAALCASLATVEVSQGLEELDEYDGRMHSRIRLGSLPLARVEMVPAAVTGFLKEQPDAKVQIVDGPYDELLHSLLVGKIDILVGALRDPVPSRRIVQDKLIEDALCVAVRNGHPLAKDRQQDPDISKLLRLQWVVPRDGTPARDRFTQYFRDRNVEPPSHLIECSSLIATRGILLKSNRAALLSARQTSLDLGAGQLAIVGSPLKGTHRPIGVTTRQDWHPTPMQQSFMHKLKVAVC